MHSLPRLAVAFALITSAACAGPSTATVVPAPDADNPLALPGTPTEFAVVSGGCFWGVQAVFQHVQGVTEAISGYAGGASNTARYELVSTGETGHAESVKITFDPARVTYGQLLRVFFSVAHDPTTKNRQGPDAGTQYRSVIFFNRDEQETLARAYIAKLDRAHVFRNPLVTEVAKLTGFYPAEAYHQNYATLHPYDPYIAINDAPKVAHLKTLFPDLYAGD